MADARRSAAPALGLTPAVLQWPETHPPERRLRHAPAGTPAVFATDLQRNTELAQFNLPAAAPVGYSRSPFLLSSDGWNRR